MPHPIETSNFLIEKAGERELDEDDPELEDMGEGIARRGDREVAEFDRLLGRAEFVGDFGGGEILECGGDGESDVAFCAPGILAEAGSNAGDFEESESPSG